MFSVRINANVSPSFTEVHDRVTFLSKPEYTPLRGSCKIVFHNFTAVESSGKKHFLFGSMDQRGNVFEDLKSVTSCTF